MIDLKTIARRKRLLYGGVSVAVHAIVLAFVFHPSRAPDPPASREVAITFKEADADRSPTQAAGAQASAAADAGGPAREGGPAPSPSSETRVASDGAARNLKSLLDTDLSALRASLIVPAAAAAENHDAAGKSMSPAEPTIHLSDGTIERLVNQGRGDEERGSGWGGVFAGGGRGTCRR